MDQRVLAGIGNIYANEALWRAGIDPSRAARDVDADEAARLRDEIVGVLTRIDRARGARASATIATRRAQRGGFVERLAGVRPRRASPACAAARGSSERTRSTDASTVLCAHCQR